MGWNMKCTRNSYEAGEITLIGCCGAYCKTCPPLISGQCKGCKLGYDDGEREIANAKCRIKLCCFGAKNQETCADCPECQSCDVLAVFQGKNGYKYRKYKESLEFIRANGYSDFIGRARDWKRAYGRL